MEAVLSQIMQSGWFKTSFLAKDAIFSKVFSANERIMKRVT